MRYVGDWAARIIEDENLVYNDQVSLIVGQRTEDGHTVLLPNGLWRSLKRGEEPDTPTGIVFPKAAVAAIAEALAPDLLGRERAALTEALAIERARVDRILDQARTQP